MIPLKIAIAALAFVTTTGISFVGAPEKPTAAAQQQALVARVEIMTEGKQAQLLVSGESAPARNALIPLSTLPVDAVAPFRGIAMGSSQYATAKKCLAQAVYYEAANEPLDGRRAVAQVVLNRVRHPAYPNSVCGVVYEGYDRPVCQFSFTCDGSLLRAPMAAKWREAEQVAAQALAGMTEADVGSATSYHADYVVPRWAYTLPKIGQLGRHIFYRLPRGLGSARALTARWNGREAIPQVDFGRLREMVSLHEEPVEPVVQFVPGTTVTPHVADRHAANDVGGRIDTTKPWRLSIPDQVNAGSSLRSALAEQQAAQDAARDGDQDSREAMQ